MNASCLRESGVRLGSVQDLLLYHLVLALSSYTLVVDRSLSIVAVINRSYLAVWGKEVTQMVFYVLFFMRCSDSTSYEDVPCGWPVSIQRNCRCCGWVVPLESPRTLDGPGLAVLLAHSRFSFAAVLSSSGTTRAYGPFLSHPRWLIGSCWCGSGG